MVIVVAPLLVHAQLDTSSIAKTYVISGTAPVSGDIVSFDRSTQVFQLARTVADPDTFGVVVTDPQVVLRVDNGGVPIVNSGEVNVNVTTANGPIHAGDYLTTSLIPGKGQKAAEDATVIIGTAIDSFPQSVTATGTSTVYVGSIRALLTIGPRPVVSSETTPAASTLIDSISNTAGVPPKLSTLLKYLLAAIITIGTIYIAFRNFGANMKDSILSIGRNPLARASIQSMVVINTLLIVLVSAAGLFVGFAVLFLPL